MYIELMKSKIHRAKVTHAELDYVGSVTIDENWMDAVGLRHNEKVLVVNNNNGERLETYAIRGERGTGIICLNGAAARKVAVNDIVIIIAFGYFDPTVIDYGTVSERYESKMIFPQYGEAGKQGSFLTFEEVLKEAFSPLANVSISTARALDKELYKIALKFGLTLEETKQYYNKFKNQ